MKAIYFDCFSGISGDMILGALIDAGLPLPLLKRELAKIPLKGYRLSTRQVTKNGFRAAKLDVHASEERIQPDKMVSLIKRSKLSDGIKNKIIKLIRRLTDIEAHVHNLKSTNKHLTSDISARGESAFGGHLHELGSADTLIDISGAIIGLNLLGIDKTYSSPLPITRGFIRTHHGRIPLPAPATAEMLKGFPVYYSKINKEIVTPTGALIITSLAKPLTELPLMTVNKIAYGAGDMEFPSQPNLLRVFLGTISNNKYPTSNIYLIETNLDDSTPEIIAYTIERLLKNGALDAFAEPIKMKKSRPGILLKALAREKDIPKLEEIIFKETSTFGIRHYPIERAELEREIKAVKTKYGMIPVKIGSLNNKVMSISPEYEDCKKIAMAKGIPLKDIYKEATFTAKTRRR
ncbi:MAG: nickel pincer cofactor biosynthesis protein LarC [Planctomycetes bacterium]|nr:nickel pincer cofactor biosynthesis protein LarC [Planctomycetota bacterium]